MSRRERQILRKKGKKYKSDKTLEEGKTAAAKQTIHSGAVQPGKKQNKFLDFYEKNYKRSMWITIALFVISLIIIGSYTATHDGEFIPRGVSLEGGITITVPINKYIDSDQLQEQLRADFSGASISVRALSQAGKDIGFIVDASEDIDADDLLAATKSHVGPFDKFSLETMGSSLGNAFFKQTLIAILIAFVLMSLVVFLSFKSFIPSFAVILSAISDTTMTVAVIDIFNIRIETAGIAALLMLVGYSVDTDVLLTTRVMKRKEGSVFYRVIDAMKTGLTMTFTSLAAISIALLFTESEILRQIMLILLIGLIFDLFNTWIQNAGILRWYMEKKNRKRAVETLAEFNEPEKKDAVKKSVNKKDIEKTIDNHKMTDQSEETVRSDDEEAEQ